MQDAQSAGFSAGGKLCRARCAVLSMGNKGGGYTYYIRETAFTAVFPKGTAQPSQSAPAGRVQLPRRGSFVYADRKDHKSSPFRGSWHRAAMTERVRAVLPQEAGAAAAAFLYDPFP